MNSQFSMDQILTSTYTSIFPLITLIFIIIFLSSFYFTLHHIKNSKTKKQKHNNNGGFKIYPLLGTLPEFLANRHCFLDWTTAVLSPLPSHTSVIVRPGNHGIMTAYPPNVEHFLKTRFDNYVRGDRFVTLLRDFLGDGIFNADGHLWRHQRKTASLEFSTRSLRNFVLDSVKTEIVTRLIPILKDASGSDRVLDLQDVLERFAFDNVCKLAFDYDPGCLAGHGSGESEFMRAFEEAATISAGRFMYALPMMWKIKKFLNIGSEKKLRDSIKIVHGFADKIVRTRLEEMSQENRTNGDSNYKDLLSRFISWEENSTYDCNFLRDVVISFILAGRDSTSIGLSWFFWLLSNNPNVLANIRAELKQIRARANKHEGEMYDFDELKEMNYLHGALSEALRLYPPVPVDTRTCLEDDVLPSQVNIKSGWFISYNTYAMGRMESIWGDDCLEFKPERWMDENGLYKAENPFKYPVFHAGPRICLGKDMAYLQMKMIAACLVEEFEVEVVGKEKCPEYLLSLTLRMKNGLPVRIRPSSFMVDVGF